MPSSAPSRATMSLTLTIGMLPLPISVFTGTQESSVTRQMYVRDAESGLLNKVGMTTYDTVTGKRIESTEVVKCIETPEGDLVEVSDDEMQSLLAAESGACTFIGFLPYDVFAGTYSLEKPYQVRAQKTKSNPYEKPFALVLESLRARNAVALFSFVSRGRTRYASLDCEGTMWTLRFDEEVREQRELPVPPLAEQELALGNQLIDTFMLGEAPLFNDEDSQQIMDFATEKAKAEAEGRSVEMPSASDPAPLPGTDLMSLLARSVGKP